MNLFTAIGVFSLGLGLGTIYFGGLWLTVRRLNLIQSYPMLMSLSFLVRLSLVLVGFYLIMAGSLQRLAITFVGFMIVRYFISFKIKSELAKQSMVIGIDHSDKSTKLKTNSTVSPKFPEQRGLNTLDVGPQLPKYTKYTKGDYHEA